MEQRIGRCETELEKADQRIEELNRELKDLTIDKTGIFGEIKRIDDKIENLQKDLKELKNIFNQCRLEQKEDISTVVKDIKSLHECMISEKIQNSRNSVIISIILPVLILAISYSLGFK